MRKPKKRKKKKKARKDKRMPAAQPGFVERLMQWGKHPADLPIDPNGVPGDRQIDAHTVWAVVVEGTLGPRTRAQIKAGLDVPTDGSFEEQEFDAIADWVVSTPQTDDRLARGVQLHSISLLSQHRYDTVYNVSLYDTPDKVRQELTDRGANMPAG